MDWHWQKVNVLSFINYILYILKFQILECQRIKYAEKKKNICSHYYISSNLYKTDVSPIFKEITKLRDKADQTDTRAGLV